MSLTTLRGKQLYLIEVAGGKGKCSKAMYMKEPINEVKENVNTAMASTGIAKSRKLSNGKCK